MARYSMKSMVAVCGAVVFGLAGTVALAQRMTPAEAAEKITGTWQINFALSPQFAPRGGGAAAPGGRGGQQQYFSVGMNGTTAGRTPAYQRGGGGGGGPLSDADRAGNAYINSLRGAPPTITFKATADSVTISDPRGERTFAVDNKATKTEINGAVVTLKSRWDQRTLKQEFVYGESRVTHDYELNPEGTRLNFKMVSSSMSNLGPPTEAKAVYDKK